MIDSEFKGILVQLVEFPTYSIRRVWAMLAPGAKDSRRIDPKWTTFRSCMPFPFELRSALRLTNEYQVSSGISVVKSYAEL